MPDFTQLLMFALVALGMVLTLGPNMVYLISRSICQGRRAGLISLGVLRWALYSTCSVRHSELRPLYLQCLTHTMRFALVVLYIFCILPGKRSGQADDPHLPCVTCRSIPQ